MNLIGFLSFSYERGGELSFSVNCFEESWPFVSRFSIFFVFLSSIPLFLVDFSSARNKKPRQLSAMDLLALASMKNAAKCDT